MALRRSLFNRQVLAALVEAIRADAFDWVAAEAAGIGYRTFYRWLARGERGQQPFAYLLVQVRRARADARINAERLVPVGDVEHPSPLVGEGLGVRDPDLQNRTETPNPGPKLPYCSQNPPRPTPEKAKNTPIQPPAGPVSPRKCPNFPGKYPGLALGRPGGGLWSMVRGRMSGWLASLVTNRQGPFSTRWSFLASTQHSALRPLILKLQQQME